MSTNSSIPDGAQTRPGPEPFLARTLSASLTVKDIERSLAWYQDVLGFIIDRKYEREGKLRAVAVKAGDVLLLIGQDDGAKGLERVKGEGLSLTITTDQDVDAIAHRITGKRCDAISLRKSCHDRTSYGLPMDTWHVEVITPRKRRSVYAFDPDA